MHSDSEQEEDTRSTRSNSPAPRGKEQKEPQGDQSVEDLADVLNDPINAKTNKFRFNARSVFLTYPQAEHLTKELVRSAIAAKWPLKSFLISEELHADGHKHFHAYFQFNQKLNSTNVRMFDITVRAGQLQQEHKYHPHIKTVQRKGTSRVLHYCMKDGDFIEDRIDMFPDSRNFVRQKADLDAWMRYRKHKANKPVKWPFKLIDGTIVQRPLGEHNKRRHYIIVGPPDIGKSKWVEDTFEGQQVWKRPIVDQYAFDSYRGQEVLIYDDVNLDKCEEELIAVSNYYKIETHVPGRTRHHETFFPTHQLRTIIILANKIPLYFESERFKARFITLDLTNWIPEERLAAAMPDYKQPPSFSPPRTIVYVPESPLQLQDDLPEVQTPIHYYYADNEYNDGDEEREELAKHRSLTQLANIAAARDAHKKHPKSIADDDEMPEDEYEYEESQDPYQ